eukprot:TRINITY_DN782_c0_g1_i2.p1 TRINITY_DN782_c0_g1~~TRINITY_DN782_c0_g1_i2.p1  ORF type:complete len:138 (+),score=18.00 TRINITY_DN782_c0_g1_i2:453-866(+)
MAPPGPTLPRTTDPLLICTDASAPPKWDTILTRIRARGEVYPLKAPEFEGVSKETLLAANKKYKKHSYFIVADEESMTTADRAVLFVWSVKGGKPGDPRAGRLVPRYPLGGADRGEEAGGGGKESMACACRRRGRGR